MATVHRISIAVLALACLCAAAPARSEDVRPAVEAANRALIAAVLGGDAVAVANFYTEDGQIIAPGAPVTSGRPAIAAFWQKAVSEARYVVVWRRVDGAWLLHRDIWNSRK